MTLCSRYANIKSLERDQLEDHQERYAALHADAAEIAKVDYRAKLLMVKEFLTHKEYVRGGWKKWAP